MELSVLLWRCMTLLLSVSTVALGKRSQVIYCGACLGLVDELDWNIAGTDKRDKVQIGSFRIEPDGKQKVKEMPLKTSEVHIIEQMEKVCAEVGRYVRRDNAVKDISTFIRTKSREGRSISMSSVTKDEHTQKVLRLACDTIMEEQEEEIIEFYKTEATDIPTKLCVELTEYCQPQNVTDKPDSIEEAVADMIMEQAHKAEGDRKRKEDEEDVQRMLEEDERLRKEKEEQGEDEDEEDDSREEEEDDDEKDEEDDSKEDQTDPDKDEL